MSKIVAVVCSPQTDESSSRITDAFLDGAMGLSTNIINLHVLSKYKAMQDCRRCDSCKAKKACIIDDDLTKVLEDMDDADCVVFSTPVYFNGACGLYKFLEDRMYSFLDEKGKSDIGSKKAVLITTGDRSCNDLDAVSERLSKNLEAFGFDMMGSITYSDSDNGIDNEVLKRAKKMGTTLRNTPTV